MGSAEFKSAKEIEITLNDSKKKETVQFDKAIIATGSTVASLPGITIDGKAVISSTEALAHSEKIGLDWRWIYWNGARLFLFDDWN